MIVDKYQRGGSGSGSTVSWNQTLSAGTEIAKITINGTEQNVYAPSGGSITIDTEMSSASTNAVQNKVIKQYVDDEIDEQGEVVSRAVNQIYNELNNKQAKLTAGSNVTISGNVISAQDTTYVAGTGIEITGNTINCTVSGGSSYEAGANITISGNVISATDTVYQAGTGIEISGNTINCTVSGGGECNYQIVDDIENIENPYTGLSAYQTEGIKTTSWSGYSIDASAISEGNVFGVNKNGTEIFRIYRSSGNFHWGWQNDGLVHRKTENGETCLYQALSSGTFNIALKDWNGYSINIKGAGVTSAETIVTLEEYEYSKSLVYEKNKWEDNRIKSYYINSLTTAEKVALYNEIYSLKTKAGSEITPNLKNYRFFTDGMFGDEYFAIVELSLARFDSGSYLHFSGLAASRRNDGKIYKCSYKLHYDGSFEQDGSNITLNTIYTAGSGISIENNVINCTVSGGTEYQAGSGITISGNTISCPNAVNAVHSTYINNIWKGTQAEYDAIVTKDNNTFYIITQ